MKIHSVPLIPAITQLSLEPSIKPLQTEYPEVELKIHRCDEKELSATPPETGLSRYDINCIQTESKSSDDEGIGSEISSPISSSESSNYDFCSLIKGSENPFAHYEQSKIGSGSYGDVFIVANPSSGGRFAFKLCKKTKYHERETELLGKIPPHKNIVRFCRENP